jgi:hypothetical protein
VHGSVALAVPLGYAIAGPPIAAYGDRAVLVGASCLVSVPCLLALALPSIRNVRRADDEQAADVLAVAAATKP